MKSLAMEQFRTCFDALPAEVQKSARESFALWHRDPKHPSLRFKAVHPTEPLYSVRAGRK